MIVNTSNMSSQNDSSAPLARDVHAVTERPGHSYPDALRDECRALLFPDDHGQHRALVLGDERLSPLRLSDQATFHWVTSSETVTALIAAIA